MRKNVKRLPLHCLPFQFGQIFFFYIWSSRLLATILQQNTGIYISLKYDIFAPSPGPRFSIMIFFPQVQWTFPLYPVFPSLPLWIHVFYLFLIIFLPNQPISHKNIHPWQNMNSRITINYWVLLLLDSLPRFANNVLKYLFNAFLHNI